MNDKVYSWQFSMEAGGGLALDTGGHIAVSRGADAIRQSILMLLATMPGERVMRSDYGCDLHRLTFAPNDDTTAGLAIFYVRRAIERFEPRVSVEHVDAFADLEHPELLHIRLRYRILRDGIEDGLDLAYQLEAKGN
jgi:hypothetical protein